MENTDVLSLALLAIAAYIAVATLAQLMAFYPLMLAVRSVR